MYTVIPTARFEKDIKYYIKKKRYFHIGEDIRQITNELQQGHLVGTEIPGLKISDHGHIFKVRSINTDTHSGQSNGYRILYYAISEELKIYLLTIYSKRMIITFLLTMKLFLQLTLTVYKLFIIPNCFKCIKNSYKF